MIFDSIIAFLSGVVIEMLYTLGVIFISERRAFTSGALSIIWGMSLLIGVNEAFKNNLVAMFWCIGLGVGAFIGVKLKPKKENDT